MTGEIERDGILLASRLGGLSEDRDPSVRLAVATACRQLASSSLTVDTPVPWEDFSKLTDWVLGRVIKSSADAKDPLLPFMIWMAGEPVFAKNPEAGLKWLAENGPTTMPLSGILARKAMRRICDTQETAKLDLAVDFLADVLETNGALTLAAIDGLIEGQKAKPLLPSVDTKPLFAKLSARNNPQLKKGAQQLGTLWGNAASVQATLSAITDPKLTVEERTKAIEAAKKLKNDSAREALLKVSSEKNPEPLVIEAIRALGEIGGDGVADDLLKSWTTLTPAARAATAEVLVSRRGWAIALLSAIETKMIPAADLPATALRSLDQSKDEFIRQRAAQVIGRLRPANADKAKIIAEKKAMILAGGPPDMQMGRDLAKVTCLVCHKLNGEGADVGPDLTGVGRSSLDALLANVIDPNQIIGKGYESVEVETKDGHTVSGRLVEDTATRVKLLSSGPKEEVIAKSDIARMRVSELSVMPEGLEQLPDGNFRNLILFILNAPQGNGPSN